MPQAVLSSSFVISNRLFCKKRSAFFNIIQVIAKCILQFSIDIFYLR